MNDAGKRLIAAAKESGLTALRAHRDDLEAERDALLIKNAALSAEVDRLKGQDWQPIETAPTDGTLCLWWDDSFRAVRLGRFRDGYFFWGGLLEARSAIPREPKDTGFTRWCLPPRPPLAEPPH